MQPLVYSILPRPPHPTRDGLAIRNFHLLRGLARRFRLRCFALVAPHLDSDPGGYPEGADVTIVRQSDRRLRAAAALAASVFSDRAYPELLYRSRDLSRRVRAAAAAEKPAWVIAHSYHVGPLALDAGSAAWVDFHNVESEVWDRMAAVATTGAHRLFARWQAPRVRALEASLLAGAAGASCVSDRDAAALTTVSAGAAPRVVPNGVDLDRYRFRPEPAEAERIFFVGDLSWAPNAEGVRWFAREVWPIVRARRPRAWVEVLGRRAPPDLAQAGGSRFVLGGEGDDTRPHWRDAAVSVVPLTAGGGTRLKILEAAACGVPVVSTRIGAEGLSFVNGEDILLADDPAGFAEAVERLLADPGARRRQAAGARARAEREYGWNAISERFADLLAERAPAS